MLTEDELRAIEARANAATPGEWDAPLKDLGEIESFAEVDFYFDHSFEAYPPLGECGPVFVASRKENADFLAHARADVPALIAEVRRLQAEIATARQTALKKAAQIAARYKDNYPEDIFTTNGISVDAQSARCMRIASNNIAAEIYKAAEETGVGLHASQQPHAVDLASASLRPNH